MQGDCLEEMEKLIERGVRVDLTVTSPPYDNLRAYEDSLQWNETIWKQVIEKLYAITTEGGVVVWVVGDATIKGSETGTSFKQALYFKEIGFNLHDTMIYEKPNAPLSHNRYEQGFEYMFVFSKGKPIVFNGIKDKKNKHFGENVGGTKRDIKTGETRILSGKKRGKKIAEYGLRENIWRMPNRGERSGHPAIFPEKLANDHIISWSNAGDTVLDPFMGSGTTGKMAVLNNRNFIGIEKVEKYFNIAKDRIKRR
jgi:site-specific DNA-methyltransferase (adenine-specific)